VTLSKAELNAALKQWKPLVVGIAWKFRAKFAVIHEFDDIVAMGMVALWKALDEGLNYFLYFGFDTHMTSVLREVLPGKREQYVLATGAYNLIWGHQNLRKTLERRLRQLRTDYIDVFHFLGVTRREHFTPRVREELQAVRESGLVRGVSMSTHDRKFAAELVREGTLDAMMIRYNAAHVGAETDIFPYVGEAAGNPGVISFTATCWTQLLRDSSTALTRS